MSMDIGEKIVAAYKEVQEAMKKEPKINGIFEKIGTDRNMVAALTEAVVIEIQKTCGVGSYGVIKEGLEWGFQALDDMSEKEIMDSLKNTFRENLERAILRRMGY